MDPHEELNAALRRQQEQREYESFINDFSRRHRIDLEVEHDWPVHKADQFDAEYREFKLVRSAIDEIGETPNCPNDLVQMEIVGEGRSTRWECPACGVAKLS